MGRQFSTGPIFERLHEPTLHKGVSPHRRQFIIAAASAFLTGCAASTRALMPSTPKHAGYVCGPVPQSSRRTQSCGSLLDRSETAPPPTETDIRMTSSANITADGAGAPIVQIVAADGTFFYNAVPADSVATYTSPTYDPSLADPYLSAMQSLVNSVVPPQDASGQALFDRLVGDANSAIATVNSNPSLQNLAAATRSTNLIALALQFVGNGGGIYNPYKSWFLYSFEIVSVPIDARGPFMDDIGCPGFKGPNSARLAMRAVSHFGMDTSHLPGTSGGREACAKAVQICIVDVFRVEIVGGTGNPYWVPDLTKGLIDQGWTYYDDPALALPGDIAVQNGQQDGGAPGDGQNPYENHIGIVVQDPAGGGQAILNNSTQRARFDNMDHSMIFAHYYDNQPELIGPPRFYRCPPCAMA